MEIERAGSQPSAKGSSEWFTGGVRIDPPRLWFAPDEKHWHGASPTTGMTHIAIQEKKDGKVVEWMEHVSDEQNVQEKIISMDNSTRTANWPQD